MSVLVLSESENDGEQLLDEQDETSVEAIVEPRLPDERANVPVSVVAERFLRAIVDKVPLDRIEELHLFSPLRQGTVETGIAVVAARVIVMEEVVVVPALELDFESGEAEQAEEIGQARAGEQAKAAEEEDMVEAGEQLAAILADERAPDAENSVEFERDEVEDSEAGQSVGDGFVRRDPHDDSPYADEPVQLKLVPSYEYLDTDTGDARTPVVLEPEPITAESHEPRIRHTVYTARYRLIVKGPERGKWEMDVVDEADAPLLAVETVVRGVQRRAGEETATVRYDASQLARVLRMPMPQ